MESKADKRAHSREYSLTKMSDGDIMKLLVDKTDSEGSSNDSDLGEWAVSKSPRKKLALTEKNGPSKTSFAPLSRGPLEGFVSPIKIKRRTDLTKEHNSPGINVDKELNLRKGVKNVGEELTKPSFKTEAKRRIGAEKKSRKSLRVKQLPTEDISKDKSTRVSGLSSSDSDVSDEDSIITKLKQNFNKTPDKIKKMYADLYRKDSSKSDLGKKSLKSIAHDKSLKKLASIDKSLISVDVPSRDIDFLEDEDTESLKENFKNTPQKQTRKSSKTDELSNISGKKKVSKKCNYVDEPLRNIPSSDFDTSDDDSETLKDHFKNTPQKQTRKKVDEISSISGKKKVSKKCVTVDEPLRNIPSSDFDISDDDSESLKENSKNTPKKQTRKSKVDEISSISSKKKVSKKCVTVDEPLRNIPSSDFDTSDDDSESLKENLKNTNKNKKILDKKSSRTEKKIIHSISSPGKTSNKQICKDKSLRNCDLSSNEVSDDGESDSYLKNTPHKQTPSKSSYSTRKGALSTEKTNEGVDRVRHSPRISKKTTNYCELSPEKKVYLPKGFTSPRSSTRSTKPLIESPLAKNNSSPHLKGEERGNFRNRMSLKRPLNEEIFITSPISRRSIQSPRTPSLNLRKQVLEATTTPISAKKKLYLEDDEVVGEEKEDTAVGDKHQSRNMTPVKRRTPSKGAGGRDSPKRTPRKCTTTPSKMTPIKGTESNPGTPTGVRLVGQGFLTPVVQERSKKVSKMSSLETLRLKLHVSTVPSSLPCREQEFANIKSFVSTKICDSSGGCMYISGVPGTGKTATVHAVIKCLQQEAIDGNISPFDFVEVNGLRLTDARQAYVRIWQSLSGNKLSPDQALRFLEKKFSSKPRRSTVLLVDELDYVCNKRQDVVYNILDWPSKQNSKLVILTIANTMDLPERTLKGKVTSRMGLTRLVFQPYTYKQLQEIVMERLSGSSCFHVDAVQLVSRKVAAVSGDARRALDICRRATEMLAESDSIVSVDHIEKALTQIFSGTRVLAIRNTTYMGQLVLRSIRDETQRTGIEETNVKRVYSHLRSLCPLEGSQVPTVGQVLLLCRALSASGLITAEQGRHDINTKLSLNVSSDDIHYALSC